MYKDKITSCKYGEHEPTVTETCKVTHGTYQAAYVCGSAKLRRKAAVTRDGLPREGYFTYLALEIFEI
jgi:hypothetical protein